MVNAGLRRGQSEIGRPEAIRLVGTGLKAKDSPAAYARSPGRY